MDRWGRRRQNNPPCEREKEFRKSRKTRASAETICQKLQLHVSAVKQKIGKKEQTQKRRKQWSTLTEVSNEGTPLERKRKQKRCPRRRAEKYVW